MNPEHISSRQLAWLIISVNLSASAIIGPSTIILNAAQSAWLAVLLGTVLAAAGAWLQFRLLQRFPGQTAAHFAQKLLGGWLGKSIGFFYALAAFYMAGICLRMMAQTVKMTLMPETPLWPFILGLTFLVVYSARQGLEVIARTNDLILPVSLLGMGVMLLLALPQGKLYWGLPVWQLSWLGIIKGSFVPLACFGEVFFVLLIAPVLDKPAELKKAVLTGIVAAGLMLAAITQLTLFVLGSYRSAAYLMPTLRIAEELNILDIFERFEPIVMAGWLTINCIKMSVLLYAGARSLSESINYRRYAPIILACLFLLPFLAYLPKNMADTMSFYIQWIAFRILLPLAYLVIPALLVVIAKVRKYA